MRIPDWTFGIRHLQCAALSHACGVLVMLTALHCCRALPPFDCQVRGSFGRWCKWETISSTGCHCLAAQRIPHVHDKPTLEKHLNGQPEYHISPQAIEQFVGSSTYDRAVAYVRQGRVVQLDADRPQAIRATVQGTEPYSVHLTLKLRNSGSAYDVYIASCTCPVGDRCKHIAAVLLSLLPPVVARLNGLPVAASLHPVGRDWRDALGALDSARVAPNPSAASIGLIFQVAQLADMKAKQRSLNRSARAPRVPRLAVKPALHSTRSGKWSTTGISWSDFRTSFCRHGSSPAIEWFQEWLAKYHLSEMADHGAYSVWYQGPAWCYLDTFREEDLWKQLEEARSREIPFIHATAGGTVEMDPHPVGVSMELTETPDGSLLLAPAFHRDHVPISGQAIHPFGSPAAGVYSYPEDEAEKPLHITLAPLQNPLPAPVATGILGEGPIVVPAYDRSAFLARVYPALSHAVEIVSESPDLLPKRGTPRLALTIQKSGSHTLELSCIWNYHLETGSTAKVPVFVHEPMSEAVLRNPDDERRIMAAVATLLGRHLPRGVHLPLHREWIDGQEAAVFIEQTLPELEKLSNDVELIIPDPLPDFHAASAPPEVRIRAQDSAEGDWLDLGIELVVDGTTVPIAELIRALSLNEPYVYLEDGTYFPSSIPELERLRMLLEESRLLNDTPPGQYRVNRFQIDFWNELESLGIVEAEESAWLASARQLQGITTLPECEVPEGFAAKLRPYQHEGFRWLSFLHEHGLGGILADDMGLGKTVQALAMLLRIHGAHTASHPSLIIAPTSVAANWVHECARFAPDLRVVLIAETDRKAGISLAERIADCDLVISTYTLLRIDDASYTSLSWEAVIFDEAQFLKNHHTKGYRAARLLSAHARHALTGTPLENNLMELWSILSIVAPGLLGHPSRFQEAYRTPIEVERDTTALTRLRKRIHPLVLRRTKDQVVQDLPAKSEQVVELELNDSHRHIYDLHLQQERQRVLGLLDHYEDHRISILQSLTKLRQLSLSPSLIDGQKYRSIPSTKLDALSEQLLEVVEEGHTALVFSQFTRFLAQVRLRLDELGIPYLYLDGSTRNRGALLEKFARGATPVFLISLKAGGFGLNLAEADYCYLLDPWWNPAVEQQAIDRIHRIGQTRPVMVYRLVARNTIEEKVLELSGRKAELFASVLDEGAATDTAITAADIRQLFATEEM